MEGMTRVLVTPEFYKAELAETLLADQGIKAFILDKRDSSYPGILGDVELYVGNDDAEQALSVLKEEYEE